MSALCNITDDDLALLGYDTA